MNENPKGQDIREELSSEEVDKVSGGSRIIKRNDGGLPYCPEKRKPPVDESAPSAAPAPAPAPAAPGGGTQEENDNITNINNGGEQKIVNQGRNNSVKGSKIDMGSSK